MSKRQYNETQITGTISSGKQSITGNATGGAGVTDHNRLYNRDKADQHPIEAITNLRDELDAKLDSKTALPLIEEALRTKAAGLYYDAKKELARKAYWYLTSEIDPNTKMGTKDSIISGPYDLGQGGGGGGGVTKVTLTLVNWPSTIVVGATTNLTINWKSTIGDEQPEPTGPGNLYVSVNDKQVLVKSNIPQGFYTFDISQYINPGTVNVKVTILDAYGTQAVKVAVLNAVSLELKSDFNANLNFTNEIPYTYIPVGNVDKLVHFIVDGTEYGTQFVKVSDERQTYRITGLDHGSHTLEVYFTATIDGAEVESNRLFYDLVYYVAGNSTPIIVSTFNEFEQEQYIPFNIPYRVFIWNKNSADIQLLVDDVQLGETLTVNFNPQVWNYKNDVPATYKLQIKCLNVYKTFYVHIAESTIHVEPVTDSLVLALSALGRSNNEPIEERSTWKYNDISCEMTNFNWASDGWLLDSDDTSTANTVLRLSGNARVRIPYKPFETDSAIKNYGKTIELEIATRSVMNYNATIISCLNGGRGFYVTPQIAALTSLQSEISTQYKEDDHVRLAFVIEKTTETKLIWMYINGIASGAIQYQDSDSFMQPTPVDITLGSNEAVLDVYNIRIYDNNLSSKQIVNNWIADTQNASLKAQRYYHNDNYNDRGEIVIEKLPQDLPYIIWDIDPMPKDKKDARPGNVRYVEPMDSSRNYTALNAEIKVQGTSSAAYPIKNIRTKYKQMKDPYSSYKFEWYDDNGDAIKKYLVTLTDGIPANYFTYKVDFASSEGANNVELVRLYNDACKKASILTPPQKQDPKVRVGIDGYPIIGFQQDGAGNIKFYSKANFNNDKANDDVYGFDGEWVDPEKTAWDGDESWETTNNSSDVAKFKVPVTPENFDDAFEVRYPDEDEYTRLAKKPGEEGYDPAKYQADLERLEPILARLTEMTTWVASTYRKDTDSALVKQQKLDKFRGELEDHFNKKSSIFYYIFTHLFLMVDSRAKNAFPTYFKSREFGDGGDRWFWLPYDMDTAIGINNEGKLVFDYSLEDTDTVNGANVFNGQDSVFWCNLRDAFPDEIKEMYTQLRTQRLIDYDYVEGQFEEHQAKWSENIFNEDAKKKYIDPLQVGDNYLEMLQGAKAEQRKWWLYNRFKYFDSKYTAGDATEDRIQFRAYVPGQAGVPKPNITITPYADIYATVSYANGKVVSKRATRGTPIVIENPFIDTEFETDQETYIYSASQLKSVGDLSGFRPDTVKISSAIKLQELKIGDDSIVEAQPLQSKLTEDQEIDPEKTYYVRTYTGEPGGYMVDAEGYRYSVVESPDPSDLPIYYEVLYLGQDAGEYTNPNLRELTIGNNTLLKKLNVKNCINLKQGIDASKCINIEEIYFDKTAIPSITLPDGGILKHLHLPETLTTLTIKNQPQLTDLVLASTQNLEKLWLENIPGSSIDVYTLVSAMQPGKFIRLIGINEDYSSYDSITSLAKIEELYTLLDTMSGLNDRGEEIRITPENPHPARSTVTGTINVHDIAYSDLMRLQAWYPEVRINAEQVICRVQFMNEVADETFVLYEERNVVSGHTTAEPTTPTRNPTASTVYTFNHWYFADDPSETWTDETIITTDLVLKTAYDTAVRQYTVIFNPMSYVVTVIPTSRTVDYHTTFAAPSVSGIPSGVTLNGWFDANNHRWDFNSDIIENDLTLFAHWDDSTRPWISTVTRLSYNTFSFVAHDNVGLASYAITETPDLPSVWVPISGAPVEFTETYTVAHSGTYYIWLKDVADKYITEPEEVTAYQINIDAATGSTITLKENNVAFVADFALAGTLLQVEASIDSHYDNLELYINHILREYQTSVVVNETLNILTSCNPKHYLVSFDMQGQGEQEPAQNVIYLHYAEEPISQYIPGYIIDGWYTEAACINRWNFETMPITGDLVLYASWVESNVPTEIDIKLPRVAVDDPLRDSKRTVKFNYYQYSAEAVKIDWGDDSALEYRSDIGNTYLTHTYDVSAEEELTYTLKIYCPASSTQESAKFMLGTGFRTPILECYNVEDPELPDCRYITSVRFAPVVSALNLGMYALRGASLTDLCLTQYIHTIQFGCYDSCKHLNVNIVIPRTIEIILGQAFNNCTNIQTVTINDSVTHIGQSAFANCTSLTTVNIDAENSNLNRIEELAFNGCSSLTHFRFPRSIRVTGWSGINDGVTDDTPSGLSTANIFQNCPQLNTAGPYNSVDSHNDQVTVEYPGNILNYFGWDTLEEVVFGSDIEYIGICAFYNTQLSGVIDLSHCLLLNDIRAYAFADINATGLITEVILPQNLISIGEAAFVECRSLGTIDIPASVRSIGPRICVGCISLSDATIRTVTIDLDSKVMLQESAWFRQTNPDATIAVPASIISIVDTVNGYGTQWRYYGVVDQEAVYLNVVPINE